MESHQMKSKKTIDGSIALIELEKRGIEAETDSEARINSSSHPEKVEEANG